MGTTMTRPTIIPAQTNPLLNADELSIANNCPYQLPRDVKMEQTFAPSMWNFWASDPRKKTFRRKPYVLQGDAKVQRNLEDYMHRKAEAEYSVRPGHFNTTSFMGESGLLADAIARAHVNYSLVNSRPKSGPVVVLAA